MKKDAEAHEADDKKFKELVETRNKADMLISSTEKTLQEHGAKATEEEKTAINAALEELKKVKDGEDKEAIDKAIEDLSKAAHRLAEEIYKEAQQAQQPGADAGQSQKKSNDDVAEAEVVD